MGQKQWVRLMTDEGVVIGCLSVPPKPPSWFEKECQSLASGYKREVTDAEVMADISPEVWLDTLFCDGRPIVLDLPLAPKQQEEFVLFRDDRWAVFQEKIAEVMPNEGEQPSPEQAKVINAFMSKLDEHFKSYGALTMEERHKVPPSEMHRWIPVPLSTFGVKGRQFTTWVPMVNVHGADQGVNPLTSISPKKVFLWNFFDDESRWEEQARKQYMGKDAKQIQMAVEGQVPPVRS